MYLLQFFTYANLPEQLQAVSKLLSDFAQVVASGDGNGDFISALKELMNRVKAELPDNSERKAALRKLEGVALAFRGQAPVSDKRERALRILLEVKDCSHRALSANEGEG